jgi:hypothetical protein
MDLQCDVFLLLGKISKHPPSKQCGPPEHILFPCKNCTKEKLDEISIEYEHGVMHYPDTLIVISISTTYSDSILLHSVLDKFQKWTHMIPKKVSKRLPEHTSYNPALNLKISEIPP